MDRAGQVPMSASAGASGVDDAFALYVHWPFCTSKCPYCDFNSHVTARVDHQAWRDALLRELRRIAPEFAGRKLTSVFFGGGTPSLMEPAVAGALLDEAGRLFQVASDCEVTLEANPGSAETARMAAFRSAGINRLSIGVQALNDADLRRLGRMHSVTEARLAVENAGRLFDRFSFDLIYGRQGQTEAQWEAELREAVGMASDHLSLYQLTIEPGTVFSARHAVGKLPGLPDEDRGSALFELTAAICDDAGLPRYEVSNHAGAAGQSRHNLTYWRGGAYAGIGPGAHGRHTAPDGRRIATVAHRDPRDWLAAAVAGNGEAERTVLGTDETRDERLVMGMRLAEGLPASAVGLWEDADVVQDGISQGWLWWRDGRFGATPAGLLLLNRVVTEISAALDQRASSADRA